MDLNNQFEYWDRVAELKHFTHPFNQDLFATYAHHESHILDYGCGYGRIISELIGAGYQNVMGVDSSAEQIKRGLRNDPDLPLKHIASSEYLQADKSKYDAVLLFAVLTCIPGNQGQRDLIKMLHSIMNKGAVLYISDLYIYSPYKESGRYTLKHDNDPEYGIFRLEEGVTLRHHSKNWMEVLLSDFKIREMINLDLITMNGNPIQGFQIIASK